MLADLAALTPPFLVAAAFLVAVGAFIRHEMRGGGNVADEDPVKVSTKSPSSPGRSHPSAAVDDEPVR